MVAATVEDTTWAEVRARVPAQAAQARNTYPARSERAVAKGELQPTTPHNFERRYTQTGRDRPGEDEDAGLEPPSRGVGESLYSPWGRRCHRSATRQEEERRGLLLRYVRGKRCSAMCLTGREHSPTVKQKEEKQQQKQPLPMAL